MTRSGSMALRRPGRHGPGVFPLTLSRDGAGRGGNAVCRDATPGERGRAEVAPPEAVVRPDGLGTEELVAIARALAPTAVLHPGMDRPVARCWQAVAASEVFEAWVIGWPPGGAIELHDHGDTAGAVVVVAGALAETSVVPGPDGRVRTVTRAFRAGEVLCFPAGHIHDVANTGDAPAVSVHVYAPRLRAMTFYRLESGRLSIDRYVRYPVPGRDRWAAAMPRSRPPVGRRLATVGEVEPVGA